MLFVKQPQSQDLATTCSMIVQAEACVRLAAMTSWLASIPGKELSGRAGDPTAMLLDLRLGPTGGGRSPPSDQARSQPWLEILYLLDLSPEVCHRIS